MLTNSISYLKLTLSAKGHGALGFFFFPPSLWAHEPKCDNRINFKKISLFFKKIFSREACSAGESGSEPRGLRADGFRRSSPRLAPAPRSWRAIGPQSPEGAWPEGSKNLLSARRLLKLFPIPKRDFASFSGLGRAATLDPGLLTLRAASSLGG